MSAYTDHDHENDIIYFGRTNYRNAMRKFGIKTDDRRRHVYVIGKTGMGKTTLLENMILCDIYLGHGCAYVDPHGDTAEKLMDYIPEWRREDVIYLNPADIEYPMGFNILEAVDESKRHVIGSGLMGVFKKIWPDVWSARMEHIMNNCILTLLENPGNSLLGINRILVDKDFRRKMIAGTKDPVVRAFWITEFEQWDPKFMREAIAPIQNKVGQFLSTALVRNIVAQQKSTIDIRDIMDQNKIFIVNLSKGRIGEDSMRLLGGMLITKFQLEAMGRVDMPEADRKDFYLYIDEFQNFATESFANILSEARKYRLALIMAHQYIEQLTEEVRAAVFGNVGTIMTFRVGSPDAVFLENEFMPRFTQEDLVNLAKFQIYLRLMIDGVASDPFSAATLPPIAQRTHSTEGIIQLSRQHYSRPRAVVEKAIMDWSEMGGETTNLDTAFEHIDQEKKERKDARKPKHEYNCTRCNKDIVLPVELDRSRPIYCDECIEIVREDRKKGKGGPPPGAPKPFSKPPGLSTPPVPFVPKQQPQKFVNQDPVVHERKESIPPVPQMGSGEFVRKETVGEVGLSALSQEKKSDIPIPSPSPVTTSFSSGEIPKKKRRRRKRKSSLGSQDNQISLAPTPSVSSSFPPKPSTTSKPPVSGGSEESVFPW